MFYKTINGKSNKLNKPIIPEEIGKITSFSHYQNLVPQTVSQINLSILSNLQSTSRLF